MLITMMLGAALVARAGEPAPVVAANTRFACSFYQQAKGNEGNLFFSPYSISAALAMTYGGARGETAKQMEQTLGIGTLGQTGVHSAFAALQANLNSIQKRGKVRLSIANSIWPDRKYVFLPAYVDLLTSQYDVTVTAQDFAADPEQARKAINTWVEDRTSRKIKDLFPAGTLDSYTRLVLANAIYFKGSWSEKFAPRDTRVEPFHLSDGRQVHAPLMRKTACYPYAEDDGLQLLELPYSGGDLSMVVILPAKANGLGAVEAALSPEMLGTWTSGMSAREVRVFLPKFKITWQAGLNGMLEALGMKDALSKFMADFSGMGGSPGELYISAVMHKAFVEMNEEGTEAAAATGVAAGIESIPEEPPEFRADRPFLFLIRENKTGSVLFIGRLTNPTTGGA